ncbi:MAG: MCE family protein [Acidobacteria bacterium]|nr:MCE family protein [Acidobacteriota bacterium]
MPQRRDIRWSQLKVGLISASSLVLLAAVIFLITGQTGLFTETMMLRTYSPDAGGLKVGGPVRLAGVDVGSVQRVALSGRPDPAEAVEIVMEINRRYSPDVREDSDALIAAEGLLGERYVNISKGTPTTPQISPGGMVPFRHTAEFSELVGGSRDLLDNLNVLTVRLNSIVGTIESGQGTIGKLIHDDSLVRRAEATVSSAEKLFADISGGKGSLGRLVASEEFYEHVNSTVASLDRVLDKVENGEGTIGKLIQDPSLYQNANQLVSRGSTLMDNINQGRGTLGKLAQDETLYQRLNSAVNDLQGVLSRVNAGEGSIGKLLHDQALYNNLNSTSVEVRELLADFRKDPKKFLTIQFRIF